MRITHTFFISIVLLVGCVPAGVLESGRTAVPTAPRAPLIPAGLSRWEPQYSTAGTTCEFVEQQRHETNGKTTVTYLLQTKGLVQGDTFELWTFGLEDQEPQLQGTIGIDSTGILELGSFEVSDFAPGEPLRVGLASEDYSTVVIGKVIPIPLESQSEKGCALSVELASARGDLFWIKGRGFVPNEALTYVSRSTEDEFGGTLAADETGNISLFVVPGIEEIGSSPASHTLRGSKCEVTVDYFWWTAATQSH